MQKAKPYWILGAIGIVCIILIPIFYFWPKQVKASTDNPTSNVPQHYTHVSHQNIIQGTFASGSDVTRACLKCHPDAASEVMHTSHWTWESIPFNVSWRAEPVTVGKANQMNNFCISAQGNQKKCTSCHVGYNWKEGQSYDYTKSDNVDCLICHADTTLYSRGDYGAPAKGVNLLVAAQSVRAPTRDNCGACHFNGGGGDNVKHGDLDQGLKLPSANLDIHMGGYNFLCTDCHKTSNHSIKGKLTADNIQVKSSEQVACTDCHSEKPHKDDRINAHTQTVACQTCHVPAVALDEPTKVYWDWSTAGENRPEDHYVYLKIKGSFIYAKDVVPQYLWYNGNLSYRYLEGDKIDPTKPTVLDMPAGNINDTSAKIFPFKLQITKQPYDKVYDYLLAPITAGDGGYWSVFNWDAAFRLAEPITGLKYSGQYGFAETWTYWPSTHMVQTGENALQCNDCHEPNGRMDWKALGYFGDPMVWGGRFQGK